jgi:hypothetical protein
MPGCRDRTFSWRIEGAQSAYAGELMAVGLSMKEVQNMPEARGRFVVMVSDCQSAIIKIVATRHDSVNTVHVRRAVEEWRWGVVLVWVPSHVGCVPNEGADIAAGTGADGKDAAGVPVEVVMCAHDVRREFEMMKQ